MALASTLVIMFLVVSSRDIPIAVFVASGFAFLADVFRFAAHKRGEGII
jgi:hypothetical protein